LKIDIIDLAGATPVFLFLPLNVPMPKNKEAGQLTGFFITFIACYSS
jgi:hypothetical protein